MADREIIRREGVVALPWAWIAFWFAMALANIGAALCAPEATQENAPCAPADEKAAA